MATITSTGVASGMDFESIIQSSLKVKQAQLDKQTKLKKEETRIELSGVGKLKSALNTFKSSLEDLKKDSSFNMRKVDTSQKDDNPFFTVVTKDDATNCDFDIEVEKLASTEKLTYTFNKNRVFGEANLEFYLGKDKETGELASIEKALGTADEKNSLAHFTLKIENTWTLENIRQAINKNDIGITASIIHTDHNDQLILDTGVMGKAVYEGENQQSPYPPKSYGTSIAILNGTSDSNDTYDAFKFDPKTIYKHDDNFKNGSVDVKQGSQAAILVDGSRLTSNTNTFDKHISGLEITATKVTKGEPVKLKVSQDYEGITKKVTDLLNAYNTLMDTMDGLYKHDTYENGKNKYDGGELAGDGQLKSLQNSLRNIMTSFDTTSAGSGAAAGTKGVDIYSLGIKVDKEGRFSLDSSKFKKGLEENFNAVVDLFTKEAELDQSTNKPKPKTDGLIHRLYDIIDSTTKTDGMLHNREEALNNRIRDYEAKEANNASYMEKYEENLRIKYSKLDIAIGNANQSMGYMQSILAGMGPMGMSGAMI